MLLVLVAFWAGACSSGTRTDTVPDTFTVRNQASFPIAAFVHSSRTAGGGSFDPSISAEAFAANRIEPGQDRAGISVPEFIGQDSAYLVVYRQDGNNYLLIHTRLYNQIELIRNRKLLVFKGS